MQKKLILCGCALLLLAAAPVLAQNSVRSAGSKISGSAFREGSAQSYSRAAYSHAEVLNDYSQRYSYIPSETATEHAAEIRRNITAAKKEVAKLGPKAKADKDLAKHVDTLNAKYDKVLADCTMVEGECAKGEKADGKKVSQCCANMTADLKAADAEHTKLNQHLKSTEKK